MPTAGDSSRSDARRAVLVECAIRRFAQRGLYGTNTQDIASDAGISQPYVYRLFRNKVALFVAAIDYASEVLAEGWTGANAAVEKADADRVARLLDAYRGVIEDPFVMRFLMQANGAVDEPEVAAALRRCYAKQVETVQAEADVGDEDLRQLLAAGLLANVVAGLELGDIDEPWARVLSGRRS